MLLKNPYTKKQNGITNFFCKLVIFLIREGVIIEKPTFHGHCLINRINENLYQIRINLSHRDNDNISKLKEKIRKYLRQ